MVFSASRPASICLARSISCSAVRSGTLPISLRYILTGSSMLIPSGTDRSIFSISTSSSSERTISSSSGMTSSSESETLRTSIPEFSNTSRTLSSCSSLRPMSAKKSLISAYSRTFFFFLARARISLIFWEKSSLVASSISPSPAGVLASVSAAAAFLPLLVPFTGASLAVSFAAFSFLAGASLAAFSFLTGSSFTAFSFLAGASLTAFSFLAGASLTAFSFLAGASFLAVSFLAAVFVAAALVFFSVSFAVSFFVAMFYHFLSGIESVGYSRMTHYYAIVLVNRPERYRRGPSSPDPSSTE